MERFFQSLLIASAIALSWLAFMIIHEFGHVVAAWLSGGAVSHVVLHPMQISWTALSSNPHPQMVGWGGPVLGSLLPLGVFAAASWLRAPGLYLFRFFAGFCLVANGVYMLVDAFEQEGDGATLLVHGASQWQLIVFGVLTMPCGVWLWHGLGPYFGLGEAGGKVSRSAAITTAGLLALVAGVELAFYS